MMMHQGLGLDVFNDLPRHKAVHALFECCCSVTWASHVADGRAYGSYAEFFTRADLELGELSDADVDALASTCPSITGVDAAMLRRELAKVNRTRLSKLLGPEGGWPPY
ncbi:OHCU decarboxylase [Rhodococcus sp. Eu-32]|uniref:2-oxo-4-hydroxy-4-carboxy-5-ureidoimidazoline decarboxylase n=1 Tax=Rhodococcus sp. Eu-32 TaxID=1017319 RepID=UPI000DF2BB7C|nr:2-oxo-4-hydroxy-4-carboxy-5-ureidoimidazoline decarboxylase [Rhodococcus sp. Eu-32]RRQ25946.1 OHCU decarboxylase [Rhodococcus sp. Eu-32]